MFASQLSSQMRGCRVITRANVKNFTRNIFVSRVNNKTFEPHYLDSAVPRIPTYPPINIQIKSYNFDVLESFQSFVHNYAENMGITVKESWATPAQTNKITNFVEGSTRVKTDFTLSMYERNVQLINMRSVDAPLLIDAIRKCLPQSVELSVHEHTQEHFEERWIPDPFIDSIRSELEEGQEKKDAALEKRQAIASAKAARKTAALLASLNEEE